MSDKPLPYITEMNRAYFDGCAQGELRLRHCNACQERFRFAHDWCPNCWSTDLSIEIASGRGKVSHFTVVHQAPSAALAAIAPYVLAMVELDEGVRMMSNVVECDPASVRIGLPVVVTYERRGDVTLPMFRPA